NLCGKHHLLGYKQPERGRLYLKCPACSPGNEVLSKNESIPVLKGIKSFKPAFSRLGEWCHNYYRQALHVGSMLCDTCGHTVPVKISPAEEIRQLGWLSQETPCWTWRGSERLVNV